MFKTQAQAQLKRIQKELKNILIIHYSCESWMDKPDGYSPRISSIAVKNISSHQTDSFSIQEMAEISNIPKNDIENHYDILERDMLSDFFGFVKKNKDKIYIHWNMRDVNYGFQALYKRFLILKGTPIIIEEDKLIDLSHLLSHLYGDNYIGHPRMEKLIDLNEISKLNFLPGDKEAEAFENKEYNKLHRSTLQKVEAFSSILSRLVEGTLKTNTKFREPNLTPPIPLPDRLSQAIANGFHGMTEGAIDYIFLKQGCTIDWWVFPVHSTGKKSADRVLGWMEGIHRYKPDEVVEIAQRVYQALHHYKRKPIDPDDPVLTELIALTQPAPSVALQRYAFHPEVESIATRYWPIGAYDTALMMVCTALDNAVQAKSGQSGYGASLMKTVFSANKPILKVDPRFGEQIGFMDLFAGAMGALRNSRAHNVQYHQSNLTEAETVEWLAFLSALFRVLDASIL